MQNNNINLSYERVILNSFIFEYKLFDKFKNLLRPETFFIKSHQDIFLIMLQLDKKEKPIDEEFINSTLKLNNMQYEKELLEILTCNPVRNLQTYINELHSLHVKRDITQLTLELQHNKITISEFKNKLNKTENLYTQEVKENISIKVDFKKLSPFLSDIIQDLIKINNYPASMVCSTVLSSMAGLIGARAKITNNINITVYPVIWSMIVAPSSISAKSTLFKFTKKCIFDDMQNELFDEYENNLIKWKEDIKNYQSMAKEDKQRESEPERPRAKLLIFANDGTPEAKIMSLSNNKNGGIVFYDEMKAELERSNNDPRYKALKTSIFDGEVYHKELVKDGSTFILRNPVLSEVGLITEQWLIESVQKNDIASGFMARYLFSYNTRADFKPLQINKFMINCQKYSDVGRFVINMLDIDRKEAVVFRLSSQAEAYYIKWFNDFSRTAYEVETDEEITASYRLSTYVLKFALITTIFDNAYKKLDIVASNLLEIDIKCIKSSIYLMELFQEENFKILNLFERNRKLNFKIDNVSVKLQKKIRAAQDKKLSKTEATNGIRGLTKEKLEDLINQGLFKLEKIERTTYITET